MLTTLERESRPVAGWTWEKVNTKSGEKQEGGIAKEQEVWHW